METMAVRISKADHAVLQQIAKESGTSMSALLSKVVKRYQQERLLEQTNRDYARLRADPVAWAEIEAERRLWDQTLMDGLEPEEW